jgi:hypothetical protein
VESTSDSCRGLPFRPPLAHIGKANLTSMSERQTRYTLLLRNPDLNRLFRIPS